MFNDGNIKLNETIRNYFDGLYEGDTEKLRGAFIEDCYLYGEIKGTAYKKHLRDFLVDVKNRKSPKELGESFKMDIRAIEILGSIAMVKLHVPMLGYNYYDFLSLNLIEGQWKIVNKLFTHVE